MKGDYSNTYWNGKGKHEDLQATLNKLVPSAGEVPNKELNPALEKFRIASNCYYDLYNNGLCNRAGEFRRVFGFGAAKLMRDGGGLTQKVIDDTESRMDWLILAAAAEQLSQSGPNVICPHCGGSGRVPTAGTPLPS
jgi:hypothetical protein